MFCPKCATQNLDGASFCRSCGANISLVPQALSGQLQQQPPPQPWVEEGGYRTRRRRELTLEEPFKKFFMGVAFLIISIVLSRTGQGWWFWMLLPAFALMATGVAQFIRLKEYQTRASLAPPVNRSFAEPPRPAQEVRNPVGSVTEGTTRHLGVETPTRHLDHERK